MIVRSFLRVFVLSSTAICHFRTISATQSGPTPSAFSVVQPVERLLEGSISASWPKALAMSGDGLTVAAGAPTLLGGAVQIYVRDVSAEGNWHRQAILTNPAATSASFAFGTSVDLSFDGTILVVGDPNDVSIDPSRTGGVLILSRDSTGSWSQVGQTLKETDATVSLGLGAIVRCSIDCSTIVSRYTAGGQGGGAAVFAKDAETNTWKQQGPHLNDENSASQVLMTLVVSSDGNHFIMASTEYRQGKFFGGFRVFDRVDGVWSPFGSSIQERSVLSSAMTISSNGQFIVRSAQSAITIWQRGTDRYELLRDLQKDQPNVIGIQTMVSSANHSLVVFFAHSQLLSYTRAENGTYLLSPRPLELIGGDPIRSALCISSDGSRAVVGMGHFGSSYGVGIYFLDKVGDELDPGDTSSPSSQANTPSPSHAWTSSPQVAATNEPTSAMIPSSTPSMRTSQPTVSRAPVAVDPSNDDPTKSSGSPGGLTQIVVALIAIVGLTVAAVFVVRKTHLGWRIRVLFSNGGGFHVFQRQGVEGSFNSRYDQDGTMQPDRIEMRPVTSSPPPLLQVPLDLARQGTTDEFAASAKTRLIDQENHGQDAT